MVAVIAVGNKQLSTSDTSGDVDFTISGFGSAAEIQGYLFRITRCTTLGTAADHELIGGGGGDGSRQWCWNTVNEHGLSAGSADSWRAAQTDEALFASNLSHGVDGEYNFKEFIDDGVRLTVGNGFDGNYQVSYVLFKGLDNIYAGTATHSTGLSTQLDVDAPGFTPDVIFFEGHTSSFDSAGTHYSMSIGAAANESGGTTQVCLSAAQAPSTIDGATVLRNDRVYIHQVSSGAESRHLNLTEWRANGFGVTKEGVSAAASTFGYLAIKLPSGVGVAIQHFDSRITNGTLTRTFGWKPQYCRLWPTFLDTLTTPQTSGASGANCQAVADIDASSEYCASNASEKGVGTTNTQSLMTATAINVPDHAGTVKFVGTGPSGSGQFSATGVDFDITTTDGTARKWAILAIEESAAASLVVKSKHANLVAL